MDLEVLCIFLLGVGTSLTIQDKHCQSRLQEYKPGRWRFQYEYVNRQNHYVFCKSVGPTNCIVLNCGIKLKYRNEVKYVVQQEKGCHLDELVLLGPMNCSDVEGDTVKHLGSCSIKETGDGSSVSGRFVVLTCEHGRWSGTLSSVDTLQHRRKRFIGLIPALVTICVVFCDGGGSGREASNKVATKYPPSFPQHCKPKNVLDNYNVASGETSVIVRWPTPSATDRDTGTPSVIQIGGGVNGGRFEGTTYGKTYTITYKATDRDGLTAYCHFSFTVTTLTCETLPWPDNGARKCDNNNNILGSSCYYSCDPGYQLTGNSRVTCQNDAKPSWSAIPACKKISCNFPTYPSQSIVKCSGPICAYRSVCTIQCNNGYTLEGPVYMQCGADGTWSNAGVSTCIDSTAPTIRCITPQIFYADRGRTSTLVNWHVPTTVDNTDRYPTVVKTDGPTMGAILEVGSYIVKYKAVDADGNESPECFIELRVEEITCDHPTDSFKDNFLVFNCSMPRYVYGVSCTLTCNSHLPLEGANLVTCEVNGQSKGIWNWTTETKPYCREIACPELDPPSNGALVYDTIQTRPVYTMMCNDDFDIPDMGLHFNGMFFCTDDGDWKPFITVPDCIEPSNPESLNLPAKIFYYGGDCGTDATMDQIEKNFKDILESGLNPYFEAICPSGETCAAESVKIICGPIKDRNERSISLEYIGNRRLQNGTAGHIPEHNQETHVLVFEFNIVMPLKLDNTTLQDAIAVYKDVQQNMLKPAVQEIINNGTFNVSGFGLKADSFQTQKSGVVKCPPGYKLDRSTCKPCPLGYFMNTTTSKCDLCSVGRYKGNESGTFCTLCPSGYSTKKAGSKSLADCSKLCSPGTYSPDTFESCFSCRHGYYQDEFGQVSCKQCPSGTTTKSVKSSSITACKTTDMCLSSPCNGHVCTNGNDSFTCTCQGGWSGSTCTVPPDLCLHNACKNSATCISRETNYECACSPGYSGTFCEIQPLNGDWSGWMSWSECTVSCGAGTRKRTRRCDSPPPDNFGADCMGNEMEITLCNVEDCPVCKEFERKYGTRLNCSTNLMTGTETCVLYCEKDKFLPPGLMEFQMYTCGPGTNYVWDSLDNPPSCVDPVGPDNVNITVRIDYTSSIPSSAMTSFDDIIGDQTSSVPCYNSPNCQINIEIEQSTLSLTFTIPLYLGPDLQYEEYISSGTASGALQELVDAISFLESTAQYIQNHTSELLDVNVSGVTYTVDKNSMTFGAEVKCHSGFVSLDGVCVACPSGTYSANGVCNFCEKGTFQANKRQTFCLPCLDGLTTSTIGSSDISQCTETIGADTNTDIDITTSRMKPRQHYDNDHSGIDRSTVFIAIGISTLSLIVAIAAISVVWYKKKFRHTLSINDPVIDTRMETSVTNIRVYRRNIKANSASRATYTSIGSCLISVIDSEDELMRAREDMQSNNERMLPEYNEYITPISDQDGLPPYVPPTLPEYTEKDTNPCISIYEEIDDYTPQKVTTRP